MIYEYFGPTGCYDEIQNLSDLFGMNMEKDDIQDFDSHLEQALLLTTDLPSDKVLEGLYVSKLQDSSQAHMIMAVIDSRNSKKGKRDYHRLTMCVSLHIEQIQRSKNSRMQNGITERGAVTKGKGQNRFTKRKTGECFQWKANGSCSRGESCSFLHTLASGNREITLEEVVNTRGSGLKPVVERVRKDKEGTD